MSIYPFVRLSTSGTQIRKRYTKIGIANALYYTFVLNDTNKIAYYAWEPSNHRHHIITTNHKRHFQCPYYEGLENPVKTALDELLCLPIFRMDDILDICLLLGVALHCVPIEVALFTFHIFEN